MLMTGTSDPFSCFVLFVETAPQFVRKIRVERLPPNPLRGRYLTVGEKRQDRRASRW